MPNWKKVIVSGSSATLNSLFVSTSVTASIFSGSAFTGSLFGTASWANNATTSSFATNTVSASYALNAGNAQSSSFTSTASSADNFLVRGTLTAQTIVVQTITSSTDFVTGSTRFGTLLSNTHQFTGSVGITGSLTVNNSLTLTGSLLASGSSPLIQLGSTSNVGDLTNPTVTLGSTSNGFYLDTNRINFKAGGSFAGGFSSDGILANQILIRSTAPNDLTTAMYIPYRLNAIGLSSGLGGNDTGAVTLITSGSARLYVSSSGFVGIGTTTPAAILHSVGSGIVNIVQSSNTVSYTQYYNTSTGTNITSDGLTVGLNGNDGFVYLREAANLILGTSDTERMRITSVGNIGIGTNAPTALLHISNSISASILRVDTAGGVGLFVSSSGNVGINTTTPAYRLDVVGNVRLKNAAAELIIDNATYSELNYGASNYFRANGSSANIVGPTISLFNGASEVLRVTGSNVGIGTTTPTSASLTVNGNVWATSFTGSLFGTSSWAVNALTASFISTSSLAGNFFVQGGNSFGTTALLGTNDSQSLAFETSGSVRMFISGGNGYVGIGTTAPTYSLDIAGTGGNDGVIRSRRIIATGGTAGDPPITVNSTIAGLFEPAYGNLGFSAYGGEAGRIETISRYWNIGMTGGTAKFNIRGSGSSSVTNALVVQNSASSTLFVIQDGGNVGINNTSPGAKLDVIGSGGTNDAAIKSWYGNSSILGEVSTIANRNGAWNTLYVFETGSSATNAVFVGGNKPIIFNAGNVGIGTTSPSARLDVGGSTVISGSLTVVTGSNIELQVLNTGVRIGNIITDVHTVTGSLGISGSVTATNFTGSLFGTASWANNVITASFATNAGSASYALTASFALNAGGGGGAVSGAAYTHTQASPSTTWNVDHSLNNLYPVITVYDFNGFVVVPLNISSSNVNRTTITFSYGATGYATAVAAGVSNPISASYALNAGNAITASFALNGGGGGGTPGGSNTQIQYNNASTFGGVPVLTYDGTTLRATGSFTGSLTGVLTGTASFATNANSSSYALNAGNAQSASFASTASSADNFTVRGTLTAQTIVVQTITSSVDFVTGSTRFGTLASNTHVFTGSVSISGSLTVQGAISGSNITGSLLGTASYAASALSASYALNAGNAQTASFFGGSISTAVSASYASSSTSASFALNSQTASFALNGNSNFLHTQSIAATTWSVAHNFQTQFPVVTVYDSTNSVIVPQQISASSTSSLTILFTTPRTGWAAVSKGGYTATVGNAVTAATASYAEGFRISQAQYFATSSAISGSSRIIAISTSSFNAVFVDYVLSSGSNQRAGTFIGTWNGNNVQFTDASTLDIGSTIPVTMSVAISASSAVVQTQSPAGWTIKTTYRTI